jgi:hypothetical protein
MTRGTCRFYSPDGTVEDGKALEDVVHYFFERGAIGTVVAVTGAAFIDRRSHTR